MALYWAVCSEKYQIMRFIKNILASTIGFFLALFLMFIFFIGFASMVVSAFQDDEKPQISDACVLRIKLNDVIKEHYSVDGDSFEKLLKVDEEVLSLYQITTAIKNAITDDRVKSISLELEEVSVDYTQLKAIRDALVQFKEESGKEIRAYADYYTQKAYYLSSVADKMAISPEGMIDFQGLTSELMFFKDFQDKYGFGMQVVRHGKYKSAAEPFLRNDISKENREQVGQLLKDMWESLSSDIAAGRAVEVTTVQDWADKGVGGVVREAMDAKMVDTTYYRDDYDLQFTLDSDVTLSEYVRAGMGRLEVKYNVKDRIAVLHAQGAIIYGEGDQNKIGQELFLKNLKKLRYNTRVKAVVLRINSPGGSALASDLIWHGIEKLKKVKPVVVSMGSYAASGGYYIACNANHIIAEPTTLTGSIGVFRLLPNVAKLSKNMGLNTAAVRTNKGPYYSMFKPLNATYEKYSVKLIQNVYDGFLAKVAKGRGMTVAQAHELAQGRVWSGARALKNGLVDQLGNLDDAIEKAAELSNLTKYKIKHYPIYKKDFKKVLQQLSRFKTPAFVQLMPAHLRSFFTAVTKYKKPMMEARLPFVMEIR